MTHLEQILQQDDPLPDVGWISGPHETPAVFELGGGAHLKGKIHNKGAFELQSYAYLLCSQLTFP